MSLLSFLEIAHVHHCVSFSSNQLYDIVEYLLDKEADITYSCEKTEKTCLHYAATMRGDFSAFWLLYLLVCMFYD